MKILLLESDSLLRRALLELLKSDGFEILDASQGLEAIEIARYQIPGLIITSLRLEGMTGFDLIKLVKNDPITSAIPVIVLTGNILPQTVKQATDLGVAAFLPKPGGLDKLLSTVAKVLER